LNGQSALFSVLDEPSSALAACDRAVCRTWEDIVLRFVLFRDATAYNSSNPQILKRNHSLRFSTEPNVGVDRASPSIIPSISIHPDPDLSFCHGLPPLDYFPSTLLTISLKHSHGLGSTVPTTCSAHPHIFQRIATLACKVLIAAADPAGTPADGVWVAGAVDGRHDAILAD